jgi:anti-anti-sigma regulatory factor
MARKKKVETEPDDVFAEVLGDIDESPLLRRSEPEEPESAGSATDEAEADMPETEAGAAAEDEEIEWPDEDDPVWSEGEEMEAPESSGPEDAVIDSAADVEPVAVAEKDGVLVLAPSGDLVGEASEALRAAASRVLEEGRSAVRIDLSNAGDVDAAGLAVITALAVSLSEVGEAESLTVAAGGLGEFLERIRLDRDFGVVVE